MNNIMKLTPAVYIVAVVAGILLSCKGNTSNGASEDSLWVAPQESNAIIDLGEIARNDTFTVRGRLYHYSFRLAPTDSLPVITNADGARYHDNELQLTIRRDSTVVLRKRFTKKSFASYVPAEAMHNSALVGFSYNLNHADDHSQLRFIATVGDPDETADIYYPVEIRVSPDGTCSFHTVEDFETESPFEGLNEDPGDDKGV